MECLVETGVVTRMDRATTSTRDAEFAEYMAARQPSLLRTAYLLTGDRHTAEDLVQTALAKLYLSWDKVQNRELVDGYVRRILVNENNSLWRRAWKRARSPPTSCPSRAHVDRPARRRRSGARCGTSCRPCPASSAPSSCSATTRTSPRPRSPTSSASRWAP